jgi:hypothetical protein
MGRKTDYTWIDSIIIELREQLQADLEEKAQFGSMEDNDRLIDKDMLPTIPPFDISSKQVYFNKAGDDEQYSTRALEIRCGGEDATKLNKMLMAMEVMDNRKGQFVPYGLGKSHPEKYSVQITENNKKLDQTMKINVLGIHNKIMEGMVDQYESYKNLRDLILACTPWTMRTAIIIWYSRLLKKRTSPRPKANISLCTTKICTKQQSHSLTRLSQA